MADAKISQLPVATTPLAGTELVPVVQGGVTVQTTTGAILTGTVPSGTANGVLYLNGSKVATSGSALTFDGASNFNFGGFAAATYTSFGLNNTASNGFSRLLFNLGPSGTSGVGVIKYAPGTFFGLGTESDSSSTPITFLLNDAEQMRLTSTGLGIGTSSPATALHVQRSNANAVFRLASSGGPGRDWNITSQTDGYLTIGSDLLAGQLNLYAGNLGLGVTPSAWGTDYKALQIGGGASAALSYKNFVTSLSQNVYSTNTDDISIVSGNAAKYELNGSGQHVWKTAATPTAGNPISFTQAMTLDANNQLLLGTTSTAAITGFSGGSVGLTIQSDVPTIALVDSEDATNDISWIANSSGDLFIANKNTSGNILFSNAGSERARIPAAGGMVVGTAALATTATDGFMYVPTCAGTPTGTPTTQTGTAPIVVDTTNNKLYFYSGGSWVAAN